MAQIRLWTITGEEADSVWSQALILQKPDPEIPKWLICVSLENGPDSNEEGQEWLHDLGQAYELDDPNSNQTLLNSLKTWSKAHPEVNIIGAHLSDYRLTCFAYGYAQVQIARDRTTGTIVKSHDHVWKQVQGSVQPNDTLIFGTTITEAEPIRLNSDLELAVEHLQAGASPGTAAIIATLNEPLPLPDQPHTQPGWWRHLFTHQKKIDTPEIVIKRRRALYAGWIILGLLVVSIIFGARTRDRRRLETLFQTVTQKADQDIATAQAMQSVDQVKARQILRETQDYLSAQQPSFAKHEVWVKKFTTVEAEVNQAYEAIAAEAALNEVPIWFSLSVVKPDMKGDYLTVAPGYVVVYDRITNTLVQIDTNAKRAEILAGGDTTQGTSAIAATGKHIALLKPGSLEYISITNKSSQSLPTDGFGWQQPMYIGAFNTSLYILDPKAGQIWRYSPDSNQNQRWLGPNVSLPSGEYSSFAIDGDIWLLQPSGRILRYRRGAPITFSINGLDQPLSSDTIAIDTSQEREAIVLLDRDNARIVQINHQGQYVKQTKWTGLSQAQSMALSDDEASVYILKDGAIHIISL